MPFSPHIELLLFNYCIILIGNTICNASKKIRRLVGILMNQATNDQNYSKIRVIISIYRSCKCSNGLFNRSLKVIHVTLRIFPNGKYTNRYII